MTDEDREHELSVDCWCDPEVVDYSQPIDDDLADWADEHYPFGDRD